MTALSDRDLLERLATERFKAAGTPPNSQYMHGPGGLLSTPGLSADIISALILPEGLLSELPVHLGVQSSEVFGILTGQTASTGEQPTAACADFPEAGNLKLCQQVMPFGRIGIESKILQVDRIGEIINRGEFLDHRIVNNPFADSGQIAPLNPNNILRNEYASALARMNVDIIRDNAHLLFDGNPANTAGSTGYIEPNGLDRLINTGYRDAVTGVACPAADSKIVDFASVNVATNPASTVTTITELMAYLRYLAKQTKATGVDWAFVGRLGLLRALARIWPCGNLTSGCTLPDGSVNNIDGQAAYNMRVDMFNNRYLDVEGLKIKFIVDDSITQTGAAGAFVSDLYIVPMGNVNGVPVFYQDWFDMRVPTEIADARFFFGAGSYMPTGGGRFLLHMKPPTNECIEARLIGRPRFILRAPFLAARITDMAYTTYFNERSPFPDDAAFYNGGNTSYSSPSFYTFIP